MIRRPPSSTLPYTLFPYTTRCRSVPGHRLATVAGLLPVTTGFGHYRQPLHRGPARTTLAHNNSFKPNALRYTNNMAGKACHVVGSATHVGLTQALGRRRTYEIGRVSCRARVCQYV